jgi:hypothetical protein
MPLHIYRIETPEDWDSLPTAFEWLSQLPTGDPTTVHWAVIVQEACSALWEEYFRRDPADFRVFMDQTTGDDSWGWRNEHRLVVFVGSANETQDCLAVSPAPLHHLSERRLLEIKSARRNDPVSSARTSR